MQVSICVGLCAAAAVAVVTLSGCGEPTAATQALAGQVTLDSKPLPAGVLSLVPVDGGSGIPPIDIVNGEFRCEKQLGPVAGQYRVEINAYEKTGRVVEDPDIIGSRTEETRQVIPAKYNRNSTLKLTIPASDAESLVFDLRSR